ncbi:Helicase IV [compost metagenome]
MAGSGKTTVALHRLAFLLYQYKEQIHAERMIIFAPNHMFIDYISEVLPELGVGDIQQSTFPDWAAEVLGLEHPPSTSQSDLYRWFDAGRSEPVPESELPGRFKGSMRFKAVIDAFLANMEALCVPQIDFEPWEGTKLPYAEIMAWFEGEHKHYPAARRKERVLARLHRWIEMELKKAPSAAQLKEWKKKAQQREKAYAKKWPELTPLSLYEELFQLKKKGSIGLPDMSADIPMAIWQETRGNLKQGIVKEEDLAPLLYLYTRIHEIEGRMTFDHVVIDEAQDFSPFQVAVLDQFVKGHSFTILGDLSQGIHYYKGVRDWREMQELFRSEDTAYFALTRSYRSTMEIISFGNEILAQGVGTELLAVPVFRSGEPVKLLSAGGTERIAAIKEVLKALLKGSYRTMALLTRTLQDASELHKWLVQEGFDINLIDGNSQQYAGGVSVLPVYLSKGLEFDAVIVTDVDREHYSSEDAKLLYVGCTRALHELWLLHGEKLPDYVLPDDTEMVMNMTRPLL